MAGEPAADLLTRLLDARRRHGTGTAISLLLPSSFDPVRLLADPLANGVVASYERPERGLALVGIGEAARVDVPAGATPLATRAAALRLLEGEVGGDTPALGPRLLGGFRFNPGSRVRAPWEPFGAGWLVLPRLLFVRSGEGNAVVVAPDTEVDDMRETLARMTVAPDAASARALHLVRPLDRARWIDSVARIAGEVRAGLYEKAVLAMTQELAADGTIAVGRALARLRSSYPDCHLFTMTSGRATFLGASPELLVSLAGGQAHALGLAGSARRGATAEEDAHLGEALLASAKDRIEHETVVRMIRERLSPVTDDLVAPNQPTLRRLRNIQHLSTDISGRIRAGLTVLDLVERLHPTPAVCGSPADVARAVIESHETFDRGWYAGPVGWMDAQGEGEFAVALRSAVVRDDRAWLFAGCGIMGDSQPELELAEVQLKFRPLTEALGA